MTERLEYELAVIDQMGYVDYYLIVHDFITYAKSKGIPVGPGRGSGAGSLVAYCIGITGIDPHASYNLLFERFLNPERVSMPDFDIDFCYERRQEVIDYVVQQVRRRPCGADHHLWYAWRPARRCATWDARWACAYAECGHVWQSWCRTSLGMTVDKALSSGAGAARSAMRAMPKVRRAH